MVRLFSLVHWVVHAVLGVYLWIGLLLNQLSQLLSRQDEAVLLRSSVASLKKVPSHLGIVVEDGMFHEELARLICWCMCVGISDVSIFDPKGSLPKDPKPLEENLHKQKQLFFGEAASAYRVQVGLAKRSERLRQNVANGSPSTRKTAFSVSLVSHQQGRWALVGFATKFAEGVAKGEYALKDLTQEFMDSNLGSNCPFDPELILQFGDPQTLHGFCPWQIRLSEIVQIHTLRGLHCCSFVSALRHFSTVEQRCGT